ncbi:S-adenosyl-L-methionine-dependent methyltransferase [Aspergillus heteromorphus CBS 117.55]|uniref:S-adenosyl-L-methionine-dependent methyltransferase n=1 Tax=Aspergillus heteromorphus CBS 117.55 TaxID=1448321 RepID=A0A317WJU6_9EURO|nr:S-adenosyl-L-methionine-dependent methyltransferase [Aspergillus heteromorphus CBS 117.55]PWY85941.1 S-adenosyl-L-methionine-dependent methyltransferase [Aspergillus heteromorphus CBS 117.55]
MTLSSTVIYDDPAVYKQYEELVFSQQGLALHPEWTLMREMIGDVLGQNIVDLGCGFGWFCKWASDHGATLVHGIDNSSKILEKAQVVNSGPGITYERADLDEVVLAKEKFDLAFSSLTFHYVKDFDLLVEKIHGSLKSGGRFVFSIQHPIWTAPDGVSWQETADGQHYWPLSTYCQEGPRISKWIANGVTVYHRTVHTHFAVLRKHGFEVLDVAEWMMQPGELPLGHPDHGKELHRPFWLIMSARKK